MSTRDPHRPALRPERGSLASRARSFVRAAALAALALVALVATALPVEARAEEGEVRVVLRDGDPIEGVIAALDAQGVSVRHGDDVRRIAADRVLRIEYQREEHGHFWLAVGLAGNVVFGSRFLLQWIASERAGRSTVPVSFWYLSIVGSLVFLAYAVHIGFSFGWKTATPLVISYAPNTIPYIRNLMLLRRERAIRAVQGAPDRAGTLRASSPEGVARARG